MRSTRCSNTNPVRVDWREVPLLTALSYGVASVEADVWLVDEKLYVRMQVRMFDWNVQQQNRLAMKLLH
jgi:hypothetical protein